MSARELTRDVFDDLPLRSMIALAAHAARRVQPIFDGWNDACGTDAHGEAVEAAIVYAESFARDIEPAHELAGEGDKLERTAALAAQAARNNNAFGQGRAAECAECAAKATINATDAAQGMSRGDKLQIAKATAVVAWEAVDLMLQACSSDAERSEAIDYIEAAYKALVERKLGTFPELGQPARLD